MVAKDGKKGRFRQPIQKDYYVLFNPFHHQKQNRFKRWLAKVGSERLEEIENPELASKRAKDLYKAKGYPEDWIEKRMRSIAIREELTDEWKQRGIGLAGGHLLQYFVFPLANAKFFYFARVDMSVITGIQGFSLKNYT